MSDTTHARIDDTFARMAAAWNAGDAAAYAAEFTPDATYVVFNGQVLRGRTAIDDTHRFLFAGPLRGSTMTGGAEPGAREVRFVRPDVVVIRSGGAVQLDGTAAPAADRASVQTYVLVDDGAGWQITAFQNTRVQQ